MTRHIQCISPVDGRIYVDRPTATRRRNRATLQGARARAEGVASRPAQRTRRRWSSRSSTPSRAWAPEIAEELAWQMGRPIRYGQGEFRGVEERARYMAEVAQTALAARRSDRRAARVRALCGARAGRHRLHHRAVELPLPDGRELGRACADRGQRRSAQTRRADAAGRRPIPEGVRRRRPACRGCSPTSCWSTARRKPIIAGGHVDHVAFTGSVEAGRAMERAAAGTFTTLGLELGGKDPAYVAPRRQFEVRNRKPGRRRLLQFRAMLLRHRAHLRPRVRLRRFREGVRRADGAIRRSAIRSIRRRRSDRWPGPTSPRSCARRRRRRSTRARERTSTSRPSLATGRHALSRAAGPHRSRSYDGGHARRELRPRHRHRQGPRRRRGDRV